MSPPDSRDLAEDFLYHLYRGSELLQDNRVLEAKEALEQALTVQPLDAKGQDLLGTVYFRLGLYPRAIQIYEGLERQFPTDVAVKNNLALSYLKTGQPEPARRVLRDAVGLNPEHKRAWGYLGLALQKLGEFEQAQIAFERAGRPAMAKRVTEVRRSLFPSTPESSPAEVTQGVRDVAQAAFSELDLGELRFVLADASSQAAADAPWHTLELGASSKVAAAPKNPVSKTLRPPWMGDLEADAAIPNPSSLSIPFSAPPVARVAPVPEPRMPFTPALAPPAADGDLAEGGPPRLAMRGLESVELHASGVVLVRTDHTPTGAFAVRVDALRIVAGNVSTHGLHRRTRDGEIADIVGGSGRPFATIGGPAMLALGARPGCRLAIARVEGDLAFVREESLVGFEMGLAYENGRIALEPAGHPVAATSSRSPGSEGAPVVQLRGNGVFVLELSGALASLPSRPGQPLLVRREWIVGWLGRLVTRALPSVESPGGLPGLVAFSGEGVVLVCIA